jgi:hypothetical protein
MSAATKKLKYFVWLMRQRHFHASIHRLTTLFWEFYFRLESMKSITFFLVSSVGVRLSPLGTSVSNSRTVPAPEDR